MVDFPKVFPTDARAMQHWADQMRRAGEELQAAIDTATGVIIGNLDLASTVDTGVVKQASDVANGTASTVAGSTSSVTGSTSGVNVTNSDAVDLATAITLVNEIKADMNAFIAEFDTEIVKLDDLKDDINTLAGDVDLVIIDLNTEITDSNALRDNLRTAGSLETP